MSPPPSHTEAHSSEELTAAIVNLWEKLGDIKEFLKATIRNSSPPDLVEERIARIDNSNCVLDMLNHTGMLVHFLGMYIDQLEQKQE